MRIKTQYIGNKDCLGWLSNHPPSPLHRPPLPSNKVYQWSSKRGDSLATVSKSKALISRLRSARQPVGPFGLSTVPYRGAFFLSEPSRVEAKPRPLLANGGDFRKLAPVKSSPGGRVIRLARQWSNPGILYSFGFSPPKRIFQQSCFPTKNARGKISKTFVYNVRESC